MSEFGAIQKVRAQRASLIKQIDALTQQLRGVDIALAAMRDVPVASASDWGRRGLNVKGRIIDYLSAAGERGSNARAIVALSLRDGSPLDRGTVSSLLSRMKSDGVLKYDGEFYRLVSATPKAEQSA